jgi:hypothetical protein
VINFWKLSTQKTSVEYAAPSDWCTPFCLQLCLSPLISPTKQVHSALLFSVSFSGLFMGPIAATLRFLLSHCVHSVLRWQVAPLHSVRVVFVSCSCYFPILSLFSCCCTSRLVEVYTVGIIDGQTNTLTNNFCWNSLLNSLHIGDI